jgi:peptidoglycan hydrolase-like protein with peptidoglycan-binding domain
MPRKRRAKKAALQRFSLGLRSIGPDRVHRDVGAVQTYLRRYGYLTEPSEARRLDPPTQEALRRFQLYRGLQDTGTVNPETASELEKPRCGVPDFLPRRTVAPGALEPFVLRGCDYEAEFRTLTYAFVVGTPDLIGANEKAAIRSAFLTWQQQIPIDFQEVGPANNPVFTIGWYTGDHGDGSPFDGVGNTLAHAFFPPPCGGTHAGKLHFDDSETWALAHGGGQFDTETVALHEIGHLLGLSHSTVPGSVMFPTYGGQRRALSADDINGIRALYGRRGPGLDVLVHLQGIGDLGFRENEFAGTRGQSRRLEGFQLQISPAVANLGVRYMAHLQNTGDTAWVSMGSFVGTRGQSRRLEGFAIELTGSAAGNYNVFYLAHLQNTGDTALFSNGQFCGTRGQSRRVEGILVRIEPR